MATPISRKNQYYIDPETYMATVHYARRYDVLRNELNHLPVLKGVSYDGEHVQASHQNDATAVLAMRRSYIISRINVIESCCMQANPTLYQWLMMGIAHKKTWPYIEQHGCPVSRNTYYNYRQRALWLLSQKI